MWKVRISQILTLMHIVANFKKKSSRKKKREEKIVAFDHKCGILWSCFTAFAYFCDKTIAVKQ